MTYEKDNIPDFALVPARQPEEPVHTTAAQGAVFSPLQITHITEKPRTVIRLEEDVLVPDTRPDLKDILDISGNIQLHTREFEASAHSEDSVSISGEISLQTLYIPEKDFVHGPVIAITNRISFREPWHTAISTEGSLFMDASIEQIEFMIINERKFRVKIIISLQAREYRNQRAELFEGLSGEDLQTLRQLSELTGTALRKKDIITIKEDLEQKETDPEVGTLLRQDIRVIENYRQATAEKVVINGFIYVSLLYCPPERPQLRQEEKESSSGSAVSAPVLLHQMQTRVEFTIFVPLSQSGQWSGSFVTFDGSDLRVRQLTSEDGSDILRLEGDIVTWLELYRNQEREIITDAYHRQKDFVCNFEEIHCRRLSASVSGEVGIHETISLDTSSGPASQILYVSAEIAKAESKSENGRILTEGMLAVSLLCQTDAAEEQTGLPSLFTIRQDLPFRCVTPAPQLEGNESIRHKVYLKDLWAEKAGAHQAEFNASVLVCAEAMSPVSLKVLKNPAFEEVQGLAPVPSPMVIYILREGDTLWSVARRFKSTVDSVAQLNQIDEDSLTPGKKLLILR